MDLNQRFSSLGFIGAGNMAGAILRAVVGGRLIEPLRCAVADVLGEKAKALASEIGARLAGSNAELARTCSSVVLAVKPQVLMEVLASITDEVTPEHRIISIVAGVPAARIEAALPEKTRVVRVMPNTPALIGQGAAAVAAGSHATDRDVQAVCALFDAVGLAVRVNETDLDAVTALSGSGPAYIFRIVELMQAAGEEMGLEPDLARRLTLQTVAGAAELARQSDVSPAELRRRVTSPGGTTAAALEVFERRGLEPLIKEGIHRARERSKELASPS